MVWQVIGDILPLAAGAGICVMPVIAVVVLLTTEGGTVKAYSVVVGWHGGSFGFTAPLARLGNGAGVTDEPGAPSILGSSIQIALGAVLLFLSVAQFRRRPKGDGEIETPAWPGKVENLSWPVSFAAGALLSFGRRKNVVLLPSAAVTISRSVLSTAEVLFASLVLRGHRDGRYRGAARAHARGGRSCWTDVGVVPRVADSEQRGDHRCPLPDPRMEHAEQGDRWPLRAGRCGAVSPRVRRIRRPVVSACTQRPGPA